MAETDQDQNTILVSSKQLTSLQNRAALNKSLLISVLIISAIVFTVMATGLTVMFFRVSALTEPESSTGDNDFQQQIVTIEQQILSLDDFRNNELKKISAFTSQLEKTADDCSAQKSEFYQQFLEKRESDFQLLLETVKSGASSLAAMNKGSKKWLESHNSSFDELKKNSLERTQTLQAL